MTCLPAVDQEGSLSLCVVPGQKLASASIDLAPTTSQYQSAISDLSKQTDNINYNTRQYKSLYEVTIPFPRSVTSDRNPNFSTANFKEALQILNQ